MGRKWAGGGRLPLSGPVDFEVKPGSLSRNAQRTDGWGPRAGAGVTAEDADSEGGT